jgi:cell fate regulator YaaT (PSP1 superfamily)
MPRIVVCTFREKPKSYHLDAGELLLPVGSQVVANTDRGLELGRVKWPVRDEAEAESRHRPVLRLATREDLARVEENRALESRALDLLRDCARRHHLRLKPIGAECLLDRARLFVFYESEERIEFREVVRELSSSLGVRVHLQSVNAREAARLLDGVGVCGQPLCCSTWMTELPPITLKMAKEQNVAGAPSKISGACGRLMCCLRHEIDFYRDQAQRLPRPGDGVDTVEGPGTVLDVNALSERVVIRLGDGRYLTTQAEELRAEREKRGPARACNNHISQGGGCNGGCSSKSGTSKSGGCGSGGCGSCGVKKALQAVS